MTFSVTNQTGSLHHIHLKLKGTSEHLQNLIYAARLKACLISCSEAHEVGGFASVFVSTLVNSSVYTRKSS